MSNGLMGRPGMGTDLIQGTKVAPTKPQDGQVMTYSGERKRWLPAAPTGTGGEFASQAEAEAGTDETKYMNPKRTAEAIAALAGEGGAVVSDTEPASPTTGMFWLDTAGDPYDLKIYVASQWLHVADVDAASETIIGLQFTSAASQYANLGNVSFMDGDFTIAFYIRPDTNAGAYLMGRGQPFADQAGDIFAVLGGTNGRQVQFTVYGGGWILDFGPSFMSTDPIPEGVLTHVVITRSGDDFSMYINGVFDNTMNRDSSGLSDSGNSHDFVIAALNSTYYGADLLLADVRLYTRALDAGEIATLAAGGNVTGDLEARWRLNEGADGDVATGSGSLIDLSGNGHNGTPISSPVYDEVALP